MRMIIWLFMAYLLTACSSNLSKGNNMMEAEQFDEAVHYYEKALLDDPGDTEVATKLYEARTRMVMANLIKVRLQRQSNQHRAAAMQLNRSLHNIKRWKIIADSNVKATIDEEVLEGGVWLNKELKGIAKRGDHNAFYYTLKQFNYIIDAGYADETINKHKPQMQSQGQQQCKAMKQQLTKQSYFLHDIWLSYCGVFAVQGSYPLDKDSTRYSIPQIQTNRLKIDKQAGITSKQIDNDVTRSIKDHPWFTNSATTPLRLNLSGQIDYDLSSRAKTFTKTLMVYDETLELIKDPKNPKKVIRKLIHKKKVPKHVKFKGKEYIEQYGHTVELSGKLNKHPLRAFSQLAKQRELIPTHDTYFKDAGIRPLKPKFKNKQAWMRQISNGLSSKMKQELDKSWINQFCSDQDIDKALSQNEYAARCSVLKPEHAVVSGWVSKEFNLSYEHLMVMLDKAK